MLPGEADGMDGDAGVDSAVSGLDAGVAMVDAGGVSVGVVTGADVGSAATDGVMADCASGEPGGAVCAKLAGTASISSADNNPAADLID
ncbi:hypothetical protein GCM10022212_07230 [Actimicrobium antarcticum]|uniref:Uncharacterized protein n=1 Tax=Actimicrobium antarcticum TaxID=1051899 RepID=A0ABP7SQQ8_9BURK